MRGQTVGLDAQLLRLPGHGAHPPDHPARASESDQHDALDRSVRDRRALAQIEDQVDRGEAGDRAEQRRDGQADRALAPVVRGVMTRRSRTSLP
jgi:hypothetical protein